MRVIAGSAKGRRLAGVPGGTRPVSDRAREGLFASLGPAVAGARVLDLYAGTGALGIEALSRGALQATFVDRARAAVAVIRENLSRTGFEAAARLHRWDVLGFLRETDATFDLVLADPPYAAPEGELDALVASLQAGRLGGPGWTVVLTRPKRGYTPVIPVNWAVARRLSYGDSLVFSYREV